jgi:hypothetical protein
MLVKYCSAFVKPAGLLSAETCMFKIDKNNVERWENEG